MSERYSRTHTEQGNYYTEGSPVMLVAEAILKDNKTGNALAQLKFQNIQEKEIRTMSVRVEGFDSAGRPVAVEAEHRYLDIFAKQGDAFGAKEAIPLSDNDTRSLLVRIDEVVFSDQSVWTGSDEGLTVLSEPVPLLQSLENPELVKQYLIDYGSKSKNLLLEEKDIWFCSCGEINKKTAEYCIKCNSNIHKLKDFSLEKLTDHMNERLEREAKEKEAQRLRWEKAEEERKEQERQEEEKRVALKKKAQKIGIIASAIIVLGLIVALFVTKVLVPNNKYKTAREYYEEGNYEEALTVYKTLNGFKDSKEQVERCEAAIADQKYSNAEELYNEGKYEEALEILESVNGYRDISTLLTLCAEGKTYNDAIAFMEKGDYAKAISCFEKISDYQDSANLIVECKGKLDKEEELKTLFINNKDIFRQAFRLGSAEGYNAAIKLFDPAIFDSLEFFQIDELVGIFKRITVCRKQVGNEVFDIGLYYPETDYLYFYDGSKWDIYEKTKRGAKFEELGSNIYYFEDLVN